MRACVSPGDREPVQRIAGAPPPDLLDGAAIYVQGEVNQNDAIFFHGLFIYDSYSFFLETVSGSVIFKGFDTEAYHCSELLLFVLTKVLNFT